MNNIIKHNDTLKKSTVRRNIITITLCAFALYILYATVFPEMNIRIGNVILFSFSTFLISFGVFDILKNGVKINNIFLVSYFVFLAMNNLNISRLQIEKGWLESYYLLVGALLFWIIVRAFDNHTIKRYVTGKSTLNPNTVAVILIIATIVLKGIIIMQTGIRLLDANWQGGGVGNQYTVGGLTGFYQICVWTLLILLPRYEKKYKIITVIMAILFEGVLSISRNNAMMIITYLIFVFAISKRDRLLISKKVIRRIIIVMVLLIIAFTIFGNYRQTMRGWNNPSKTIEYLLQSNISNGIINWIYGYTAINYDVMLQTMATANHPMTLYSVLSPYVRLLFGYSALTQHQDSVYHIQALNGFNASTIFGPMIYEMGELYIIQVFLLAIQVGLFGLVARKQKADGHYAYLIAFGALSVFGNFFSIAIYAYVSIAAMIIQLFIPLQKEELQT